MSKDDTKLATLVTGKDFTSASQSKHIKPTLYILIPISANQLQQPPKAYHQHEGVKFQQDISILNHE